ncbi:thiamine ABC transport system, permease protein [Escherichia coli]|uniref:Thiamine ABC transport system, permease protein n=1 Tax=Escherichia coli TaxID=562 RepID=A0A377KC94_ECOLX|nr:thiamine ABC transport system, permease protein [Escherichia coli]
MATRRQPLIPGWLIPGVSDATLVVAVALAAFSRPVVERAAG